MSVGHYQLFKFSLASEAVLADNRIVLLLSPTHFCLCPPLLFPPCVLERVMGTVFARQCGQGLRILRNCQAVVIFCSLPYKFALATTIFYPVEG